MNTTNTNRTRVDNAALFALLSSLADNKQAIGRRYAYWCNGAPALEAAVAAAAMTQDELGHARTLYPLLNDFVQAEVDPTQVEPETRTLRYAITFLDTDFAGWSDFVATNFLFDTALTTLFEAAQHSRYEPLRQRSRKIIQEERIHQMHGEGWIRRLAKARGIVPQTLRHSLDSLWNETLCWFGPNDDPVMQQLYHENILDATPDELRSHYLGKVMPVLQSVGISMPATYNEAVGQWQLTEPLPWSKWNETARRLQDGKKGVTPRQQEQRVSCPYCNSLNTELFSLFGQQLLTVQYYCNDCHTPFEHVKDDDVLNEYQRKEA